MLLNNRYLSRIRRSESARRKLGGVMSTDLALLGLRLVVGGLLFGHGAQKLFGWFGGPGLAGTIAYMGAQFRLRPAALWATIAALSEFGGGLLLAVGLLSPLGSVAIIAAMLTAI